MLHANVLSRHSVQFKIQIPCLRKGQILVSKNHCASPEKLSETDIHFIVLGFFLNFVLFFKFEDHCVVDVLFLKLTDMLNSIKLKIKT